MVWAGAPGAGLLVARQPGRSGEHCLDWLEDWVANNPPYIAFTWIDAFLTAFEGQNPGDLAKRLAKLRADILPAHAWFTWRHRTFGSSANNCAPAR